MAAHAYTDAIRTIRAYSLLASLLNMHRDEQSTEVHGTLDFHQITDEIFIGTNACCKAHFDEHLITQHNIRAEISLEKERLENPWGVDFFLWLPTVDHAPPTQDQFDAGVALLQTCEKNKLPVYVHCKNGHGRAPTLVAAFLIRTRGLAPADAVAYIKERRLSIHLENSQRDALKTYQLRLKQ